MNKYLVSYRAENTIVLNVEVHAVSVYQAIFDVLDNGADLIYSAVFIGKVLVDN